MMKSAHFTTAFSCQVSAPGEDDEECALHDGPAKMARDGEDDEECALHSPAFCREILRRGAPPPPAPRWRAARGARCARCLHCRVVKNSAAAAHTLLPRDSCALPLHLLPAYSVSVARARGVSVFFVA
jgi:hypothetical protein